MNLPPSPTVILIPGFMLDDALWDEMLPHFPSNWSVYKAQLTAKTTAEIVEMIAVDVNGLASRKIVIGFSLGGYIARIYAQRFPDQLLALILIASSQRLNSPQQSFSQQQQLDLLRTVKFSGLSLAAIRKSLAPLHAHNHKLLQSIQEMGRRLGPSVYENQLGLRRELTSLAHVTYPTLVITADQDRIRSFEESAELVEHIPDAELVMIKNSGHMIPLEQPVELAKTIHHWLSTKI